MLSVLQTLMTYLLVVSWKKKIHGKLSFAQTCWSQINSNQMFEYSIHSGGQSKGYHLS